MKLKRSASALCATALAVAYLVVGAGAASATQVIEHTFVAVQCQAKVGSSVLTQSQDITVRLTAPDQVVEGSTFAITFPGGSAVLPSTASGLQVVSYQNLLQTFQLVGSTFNPGSIVVTGQTTINGTPITGTTTLPTPDVIAFGTPGPFPPGTLGTPDISVDVTAGAAGTPITLHALKLTTTANLRIGAQVVPAAATCNIPQDTLITIPVVPATVNTPPTVDAGTDVSGTVNTAIALDATVTDPDDTPTTAWTINSGTCSFADPTAVDTSVTCTSTGTFTATLTANDGTNPPVSDTAQVTVNPAAGGCSGPCLSIGDSTAPEGATASLAVTLTQPLASDLSFTATIGGGTATNGYKLPAGSVFDYKTNPVHNVTIKAGKLKAYVNVRAYTDALVEPNETFTVTLSGVIGATVNRGTGNGTILDTTNAAPGTVFFGSSSIVEVDPCVSPCVPKVTAKVPVYVVPPSDPLAIVTVEYQTQDAGATAGVDYMPKVPKANPLLVTFKPGQTHKFVTVIVLGDDIAEPTEGVNFVFSNPVNALFGNGSTAHVDILDDDS